MKRYVLGFAFDENKVLLIQKVRPSWQAGCYNGLGGSIEENETPVDAMVREFKEECGIETEWNDWQEYAVMHGKDWIVHCFRNMDCELKKAKTQTDERIASFTIQSLHNIETISNVPALVALAYDKHGADKTLLEYLQ